MHIADALISPAVGGAMLAAAFGTASYSLRKNRNDMDENKVPLMGVTGAFVFAAQMINFTIPGTGSSGHIGGAMLLAVMLGPYAGFLVMASVLLIQALFFGDGGLLAYGCNLFNLGFYSCFATYPCIYKRITGKGLTSRRIFTASIAATVIGLQLGAFSVVLETLLSGKTELPFGLFVLFMQPIHLAIGLVEGFVTGAVVDFVWRARPEILDRTAVGKQQDSMPMRKLLIGLTIAAVAVGGILSLYASAKPDGLEWSIERTAGTSELETAGAIHETLSDIQSNISVLPDYGFKDGEASGLSANAGTSVSGIVGGAATLVIAALTGWAVNTFKNK